MTLLRNGRRSGEVAGRVRPVGIGPGRSVSVRSLMELTKPRLSLLSVLTALAGYAAARPGWDPVQATVLLAGTALAAAGALGLNQWIEREVDALMDRTRDRPIPTGKLAPGPALVWVLLLAVAGVGILLVWVNPLAAGLAAATVLVYAGVYTPLKQRTRWATEIGAVAGALPPLVGWAAAEGRIAPLGWFLFAILALWQMPHFFAVGWVYREDYRAAGFKLLPVIDWSGRATGFWSALYALALVPVSVLPWFLGLTGAIYGWVALASGGWFAWLAVRFALSAAPSGRLEAARRLFHGSLLYLPVLLAGLVIDRLA